MLNTLALKLSASVCTGMQSFSGSENKYKNKNKTANRHKISKNLKVTIKSFLENEPFSRVLPVTIDFSCHDPIA